MNQQKTVNKHRQYGTEWVATRPKKERQWGTLALSSLGRQQSPSTVDFVHVIDVHDIFSLSGGHEIISEGDLIADYFYICQSGTFEIFVTDSKKVSEGRGIGAVDGRNPAPPGM